MTLPKRKEMSDQLTPLAEDVRQGLSSSPKFLLSKYFYDEVGSELFRQIMKLPEYYLTAAETKVFQTLDDEITETFLSHHRSFDLIELGPGDGTKTAILIDCLLKKEVDLNYLPIDISAHSLEILAAKFKTRFPSLSINPIEADYLLGLNNLKSGENRPKIVLFLGSNIGNLSPGEGVNFLKDLSSSIDKDDLLLVGFDLQKDPRIILKAYDDTQGVTARFNLNLLNRINQELGADFKLDKFSHYAIYNPLEGAARSFLISLDEQIVSIEALQQTFNFKKWEPVYVEISQKYTTEMIGQMAAGSGFEMIRNFYDPQVYFTNSLWKNLGGDNSK